MNSSMLCSLRNPSAALARQIEDTVLNGADSNNLLVKGSCWAVARLVSAVVFPVFLTLELVFKKVPEMMIYSFTPQFQCVSDEAMKFLLAIIPSMLFGLYAPVGMPGFFLQRTVNLQQVLPFGVERSFGTTLSRPIEYPMNAEDLQQVIQQAIQSQQQVSVIGEGMSQGWQTIPMDSDQCVIHTRKLKQITVDVERNTVTVGAGVTWEELQLRLDPVGKSSIVKQASDVFSIGGSIGINCHGWAHQEGAIAKTVMSLKIIDATGQIRILSRPRDEVLLEELSDDEQLFKCMFGTMGYFGVVVEATLQIVDNEVLMEDVRQVDTREFERVYQEIEHDSAIPLFGGRLSLDAIQGNPLREVAMLSYRKTAAQGVVAQRRIELEPVRGTRISRIGLQLLGYIPAFAARRLTSWFWSAENEAMGVGRTMTRNEALHPPIKSFMMLHDSNLNAQWLQEYFIKKGELSSFLDFLGGTLKQHSVRLVNATIRPTPKDTISILPYAEQDRFAVVICFAQQKTKAAMEKTKGWIQDVHEYLFANNGVFYQAYMPYATRDQFEKAYGLERINVMHGMKEKFDPSHVFGNRHTQKYYD